MRDLGVYLLGSKRTSSLLDLAPEIDSTHLNMCFASAQDHNLHKASEKHTVTTEIISKQQAIRKGRKAIRDA